MTLTTAQILSILREIDKNMLVYIGVSLGGDVLTVQDRELLRGYDVDLTVLAGEFPPYYRMFLLGRLTQLIGDYNSHRVDYADFDTYLKRHQFTPLNAFERTLYDIARRQTYTHLKNLTGVMRTDVETGITTQMSRAEYETVFHKEISQGELERRGVTAVISDIGHQTGDWTKDLGRIVDTEMNNILQQGRVVQIIRDARGGDPLVYKDVFPGACRHCIRLYLTKGIGSEPRVFRLSQLVANGTNIGRKVKDWRAVVGTTHPFCRCLIHSLKAGMRWDKTKHRFVYDERWLTAEERRLGIERGTITYTVGDKTFTV